MALLHFKLCCNGGCDAANNHAGINTVSLMHVMSKISLFPSVYNVSTSCDFHLIVRSSRLTKKVLV